MKKEKKMEKQLTFEDHMQAFFFYLYLGLALVFIWMIPAFFATLAYEIQSSEMYALSFILFLTMFVLVIGFVKEFGKRSK